MTCPKCGLPDAPEPACPRCGVVFAKLRESRPRPAPARPAPTAPPAPRASGYGGLAAPVLLLVLGIGGVAWWRGRPHAPAASAPAPPAPPRPAAGPTAAPELPPATLAAAPPPTAAARVEAGGLSEADVRTANELAARVNARALVGAADIAAAEDLCARNAGQTTLRDLFGAVLMTAAVREQADRRFSDAAAHYRRAAEVQPRNPQPRLGHMNVLLATGDWAGAETVARDVLALQPASFDALQGLAIALFRQDRNREAADALKTALGIRDSPEARALLDRIQKGMADEKGMTEQRLSHFNVRYDGETHDDVGREILRALERHFATLTQLMDHQPQATIPVILFTQASYYDAAGAPAWSGGAYDPMDGRIRIPIGGLTASLTPDMDQTLIHELTHAFIADRSRGLAPRDIHEGLAQYMEGKRLASMLSADQLRALADGRAVGVGGFYLQALSFVEYLMALRGQGGMNDLLKSMAETGDVDEAFRRVYGQDYRATQQAWIARMRQQYGS